MPGRSTGEIVCLVNRTTKNLTYMFDGYEYTLEPGENYIPEIHVFFARNQNPRMGTQSPWAEDACEYLVGIKAKPGRKQKDDISPIEQTNAKERLNRSELDEVAQTAQLKTVVGRLGRSEVSVGGPAGSAKFAPQSADA